MGRQNRSHKRRDKMNRVKRERNAKKELASLKKMLGIDDQGNVDIKEIEEVVEFKTAKQLKKERREKEEEEVKKELEDLEDPGEDIEIVNENTGKKHVYNTKTLKDENGSYAPWCKQKKTQKKVRKLLHSRKQKFKQAWCTMNVPL